MGFRFRPGKEWGSKARKAEDSPGRKSQERQAAIDEQAVTWDVMYVPWSAALADMVDVAEDD
jgi:hypothetical protein